MNVIHFVEAGRVERFRKSKRGYVWLQGYSRVVGANGTQPWFTKAEAYAQARKEGCKARFFTIEQDWAQS